MDDIIITEEDNGEVSSVSSDSGVSGVSNSSDVSGISDESDVSECIGKYSTAIFYYTDWEGLDPFLINWSSGDNLIKNGDYNGIVRSCESAIYFQWLAPQTWDSSLGKYRLTTDSSFYLWVYALNSDGKIAASSYVPNHVAYVRQYVTVNGGITYTGFNPIIQCSIRALNTPIDIPVAPSYDMYLPQEAYDYWQNVSAITTSGNFSSNTFLTFTVTNNFNATVPYLYEYANPTGYGVFPYYDSYYLPLIGARERCILYYGSYNP